VLAPGLRCVFCGINPGRVSAAAQAHFANPRNDFWRLLHDAGFTPRLLAPDEQFTTPEFGVGLTNAAFRTTPGSGDLRAADFRGAAARLERLAVDLRPRAIAFVGKEAYRGAFGERPELGVQRRTLADTGLFVLPSTSPANAAVPYDERLRWFRALAEWLDRPPRLRPAVRALVVDERDRTLLLRWARPQGSSFWVLPGGAIEEGESPEEGLRRELVEEVGLHDVVVGSPIWTREFVFAARDGWIRQTERLHAVRAPADEVNVPDLSHEDTHEPRWWTADEIAASDDLFSPSRLAELFRGFLECGPPPEPVDVGI
jgi:G:T/U-mismatch repair DNA glycosylase/ADP-ribose pyrophosphatase YjhB (NUDIX family)